MIIYIFALQNVVFKKTKTKQNNFRYLKFVLILTRWEDDNSLVACLPGVYVMCFFFFITWLKTRYKKEIHKLLQHGSHAKTS